MKTDKELLTIWKDYSDSILNHKKAEVEFESLEPQEKLRIFDLIKDGEHLE